MLIYDSEVKMDAAISCYREYFQSRYERQLNLRSFCESIKDLELLKVIDAITTELHEINNIDKNNKKKDIYKKDLKDLLKLFTNTTFLKDKARVDFIKDTYPLLIEFEDNLFSVQSMNLVKISEVYHCNSDETYYVSNKQYNKAYEYISDNIEKTKELLIDDDWKNIGKVVRYDDVLVEAYSKNDEIIAL